MTSLQAIQRDIQRHVMWPDAPRAVGGLRHIVDAGRISATQRLGIYASGYQLRLIEALQTDYPAVLALTGEDWFDVLARGYIAAHASRHPNLRWYGGGFAAHLRVHAARRPVLAEVAQFEWAVGLAFDAADASVITLDDMARVSPELWPGLGFTLHPAVQRLSLQCNAPAIWAAHSSGAPLPRARKSAAPRTWGLWRREQTPRYRQLPADEAWALAAVARGRNFAQLCAGLCRWVPQDQAPMRAATLLKTWVAEGMISSIVSD
ncbi:MAG: DUF2063 domain-containing protein [Ramlibacter sp.]